jgi:hypothetical protein
VSPQWLENVTIQWVVWLVFQRLNVKKIHWIWFGVVHYRILFMYWILFVNFGNCRSFTLEFVICLHWEMWFVYIKKCRLFTLGSVVCLHWEVWFVYTVGDVVCLHCGYAVLFTWIYHSALSGYYRSTAMRTVNIQYFIQFQCIFSHGLCKFVNNTRSHKKLLCMLLGIHLETFV